MPSEEAWEPKPPHDCRITARCFRESFGFQFGPPYDFAPFRDQNTAIDTFFAKRENDPAGGEGGERVGKVKQRPVFSLHVGKRTRGATWFDRSRPPEGIVWLCSCEPHDERFKDRDDAYDRFATQEAAGNLYPQDVDYKALELTRRIRDANWSTDSAILMGGALLKQAATSGAADGAVCGITLRLRRTLADPTFVVVAVSQRPVNGELSGVQINLTDERFYLVAAAMKQAAAVLSTSAPTLDIPTHEFPGGLKNERAFELAFELRSPAASPE